MSNLVSASLSVVYSAVSDTVFCALHCSLVGVKLISYGWPKLKTRAPVGTSPIIPSPFSPATSPLTIICQPFGIPSSVRNCHVIFSVSPYGTLKMLLIPPIVTLTLQSGMTTGVSPASSHARTGKPPLGSAANASPRVLAKPGFFSSSLFLGVPVREADELLLVSR